MIQIAAMLLGSALLFNCILAQNNNISLMPRRTSRLQTCAKSRLARCGSVHTVVFEMRRQEQPANHWVFNMVKSSVAII